jgi:hypothetical protein
MAERSPAWTQPRTPPREDDAAPAATSEGDPPDPWAGMDDSATPSDRPAGDTPPSAYRPPQRPMPSALPASPPSSRPDASATAPPTSPRRWPRFALSIDEEATTQLALVGAALAVAGFLLPWARTMIGASGTGSWFDRWGLANPAHLPVFVVAIGTLALALAVNRVPSWLRTGALGLVLAGLLAGLAWPYLFGRLEPMPGIYIVAAAALILATAGLLSIRPRSSA